MWSDSHELLVLYILSTYAVVVAGSPSSPPRSRAVEHLPLRWDPFGFLSEMTLGTPPQKLTSFIDWTWISQVAIATFCNGVQNNIGECLPAEQQYFNESLSTTYRNESERYATRTWNPNHFFFDKDFTARYSSDVLTVGPSSSRVIMQTGDMSFKSPSIFPFGAIYGLSPVFPWNNVTQQSPFYQAWKSNAWERPLMAFHQCYEGSPDRRKATCGGADGRQTLGGYDRRRVRGRISWHDVIRFPLVNVLDFIYDPPLYQYWTVALTGLSIGDEPQAINRTAGAGAVFDNASYGRGAPLSVNAYAYLVSVTQAKPINTTDPINNGGGPFFEVDCNRTSTFPPIKYRFGGDRKAWEIPAKHYVDRATDGKCVLNVRTLGSGDMVIGNFGETFLKDKYVIMDFEKLRVGLAHLSWY